MTNRRSSRNTQITWRPCQWRHVGGQFWREWRQLRICQITRELAHVLGHHAGTCGPHPGTIIDARGLRRIYQRHRTTNVALYPIWRYQIYGDRQHQDHPDRKNTKKMALCRLSAPYHHHRTHPWQTPQSPQMILCHALALSPDTPQIAHAGDLPEVRLQV